MRTTWQRLRSMMIPLAAMGACQAPEPAVEPEPVTSRAQSLSGGSAVPAAEIRKIGAVMLGAPGATAQDFAVFCSGMLVRPTWVLTAGQCNVPWILKAAIRLGNIQSASVEEARIKGVHVHPTFNRPACLRSPQHSTCRGDAMLVELASPLFPRRQSGELWPGYGRDLHRGRFAKGYPAHFFGYGPSDGTGSGTLRFGTMTIDGVSEGFIEADDPAVAEGADWGGALMIPGGRDWRGLGERYGILGIASHVLGFAGVDADRYFTNPAMIRDWFDSTLAMQHAYETDRLFAHSTDGPGDYDGDGKSDLSLKDAEGRWLIDYARNGFGAWDAELLDYGGTTTTATPADYDGDGKTDLSVKTTLGGWLLDFAANGLGSWDQRLSGYGDETAIPVPADYDGDGKADLSVKTFDGRWLIDMANNGFGRWDRLIADRGDAGAVPTPGDYDGDGRADLSVKTFAGMWRIDFASNGFGRWDIDRFEYGGHAAVPTPADYDCDGKTDLSVKTFDGRWLIDMAANGFNGWDIDLKEYGGGQAIPVPGDYDGDCRADLSVKNADGLWYIDYAANGIGGWDAVFPEYGGSTAVPAGR